MKQISRNIIKAIAGVSAVLTLCGTTALGDPSNPPFLFVDMDGNNGPTQAGFCSLPVPSESANTYGMVLTSNYPPSQWAYSNQNTPTGAVTVVVVGTNDTVNIATNVIDPFPSWISGVGVSPNGIDRGSFTNGDPWGSLHEDFLMVSHDTMAGFGDDQVWLTVSNLVPGSNYEVTVWDFDQANNDTSTGFYVAWSTNNPDPYGTNSYQPPYPGTPGNGGICTAPRLARVACTGPEPTNEYAHSGSFFVPADANGTITVYGWEDGNTFGGFQWVPFNGFALGLATSPPPVPLTNIFTNIIINPPLTALGPPTVWGYNAAAWNIYSTNNYVGRTWSTSSGVSLRGEAFYLSRDLMLRNFYMAMQVATNTGCYTLGLYDLGMTNITAANALSVSNGYPGPDQYNLLSYWNPYTPQQYWEFVPTNIITNNYTNTYVLKFKMPVISQQIYLSNGHTYFLGMQFVPGSGSNNLVWEGTTNNTYTDRAGFHIASILNGNAYEANDHGNLVMAIDGQNPNLQIAVSNYVLDTTVTNWPVIPGMANGGKPVITVQTDQNDTSGGADPGYLDFISTETIQYVYVGQEGGCPSMSFYNTNTFNLGAVAVVERGSGSSNVVFSLNVYQITNTFFTATNTVEKWPRNFQPSTDSPLGATVWNTNVDFLYPTNNNGGAASNQILAMIITNTAYQIALAGTNAEPYKSYAVEFIASDVGENAANVLLLRMERDNSDSLWQNTLFPNTGGGTGYRTNVASAGVYYNVEPAILVRAYPDPEQFAGGVVGAGLPRHPTMAIYAAPLSAVNPTNIVITSVARSNGTDVVLNWTQSGGSGAYTYSVLRTNMLKGAPAANWPVIASNLPAATTSYTDTNALAISATNYYRVHSP